MFWCDKGCIETEGLEMVTFTIGLKVMLDDECEGTIVGYNDDLEAYKVRLDNGRYELAYEHQLEELED